MQDLLPASRWSVSGASSRNDRDAQHGADSQMSSFSALDQEAPSLFQRSGGVSANPTSAFHDARLHVHRLAMAQALLPIARPRRCISLCPTPQSTRSVEDRKTRSNAGSASSHVTEERPGSADENREVSAEKEAAIRCLPRPCPVITRACCVLDTGTVDNWHG